MTLVVNLFGGPGVSKSTTTALVYGKLKVAGINAEIVPEYAKDLTWEKRTAALGFQPYVAAKQMWRIHRLLGQVDVIVTDSPIILSAVYKGEGYTPSFEAFLFDTFNAWDNLNIELERNSINHFYNTAGRSQTEEEAQSVDDRVDRMLHHHGVPHRKVKVQEGEATAEEVLGLVFKRLQGNGDLATIIERKKAPLVDQMLTTTPK